MSFLRFCVASLASSFACLPVASGLAHRTVTPADYDEGSDEDSADLGIGHILGKGGNLDSQEAALSHLLSSVGREPAVDDASSIDDIIAAGDLESSALALKTVDADRLVSSREEHGQEQGDSRTMGRLGVSRDAVSEGIKVSGQEHARTIGESDISRDDVSEFDASEEFAMANELAKVVESHAVVVEQPEFDPNPPWDGQECRVPQCSYINLDRRSDRSTFIEDQLLKADVKCQRSRAEDAKQEQISPVDASRHSHISALKKLQNSNAAYGLILEDDAEWKYSKSTIQAHFCNVNLFLKRHPVILLACNLDGNPVGDDSANAWLKHAAKCQTATAYIVRRDYVPTLIKFFQNQPTGSYIDQAWKTLQQRDDWAMTWPPLVKQHPFYSDIEEKMVDYGVFLSK